MIWFGMLLDEARKLYYVFRMVDEIVLLFPLVVAFYILSIDSRSSPTSIFGTFHDHLPPLLVPCLSS